MPQKLVLMYVQSKRFVILPVYCRQIEQNKCFICFVDE